MSKLTIDSPAALVKSTKVKLTDAEIQEPMLRIDLCNSEAPRDLKCLIASKGLKLYPAIKKNNARRASYESQIKKSGGREENKPGRSKKERTNKNNKVRQPNENLVSLCFSKQQESVNKNRKDYEPCKEDMISRYILWGLSYSEYTYEYVGVFVGHYIYNTPLPIIQKIAVCFDDENIYKPDKVLRRKIKGYFGLTADLETRPASKYEESFIEQCLKALLLPYPTHSSVASIVSPFDRYFDYRIPQEMETDPDTFYLTRNHLIACPQCYGWASLLKDASKIEGGPISSQMSSQYSKIHVPTFVDAFKNGSGNAISLTRLSESELELIKRGASK